MLNGASKLGKSELDAYPGGLQCNSFSPAPHSLPIVNTLNLEIFQVFLPEHECQKETKSVYMMNLTPGGSILSCWHFLFFSLITFTIVS